jgi:oxidoreductase
MSASSSSSPPSVSLKVVVVGSTGATGTALVAQLLQESAIARISALVRKAPPASDTASDGDGAKLEHRVVDFDNLKSTADGVFNGVDVVFCTLGTTRKVAGKAGFIKVDHDYVLEAAQLARDAGVRHFSIVTSQGASASSLFLYMSVKGKVEDALRAMKWPHLTILQPGMLDRPNSQRIIERIAASIIPALPVSTLACAMMRNAIAQAQADKSADGSVTVLSNGEIKKLGA